MSRTICIYHANCVDGFTAAWAVREALGDEVEFIPASYGSHPPDVTDADVVIVDFSYPKDVLEDMNCIARSVLVLDHHKTAQANLEGLPEADEHTDGDLWGIHLAAAGMDCYDGLPAALFDMNRSGAQMAWDFFHDRGRPMLIDFVADRDLWNWALPRSREISAVIASHDFDFSTWSELAYRLCDGTELLSDDGSFLAMADEGAAILRKMKRDVKAAIGCSRRSMIIGGRSVPVANVPPFMASEAAGQMAESAPFAATYYDGPKGRAFSLRSRGDEGVDVSEIAQRYGGGGHRNAAGFLAERGWEGEATQ